MDAAGGAIVVKCIIKLGMLDSAEEVIRQISLLYPNTAEYDASLILKEKLVELRAIEAIETDS